MIRTTHKIDVLYSKKSSTKIAKSIFFAKYM